MSITIPELPATVEKQLFHLARLHGRTPEAEALEILAAALGIGEVETGTASNTVHESVATALANLTGIWKGRDSTAELMQLTRAED